MTEIMQAVLLLTAIVGVVAVWRGWGLGGGE